MREVIWRPRAEADLDAITNYTIAEWGAAQAKRYVLDIRRQIDFAIGAPGIGSEAYGLPAEYRKLQAGRHRVIYRYTENELIVVRIIHEREDAPDDIEDFW